MTSPAEFYKTLSSQMRDGESDSVHSHSSLKHYGRVSSSHLMRNLYEAGVLVGSSYLMFNYVR